LADEMKRREGEKERSWKEEGRKGMKGEKR
jgi:hypothetical protein